MPPLPAPQRRVGFPSGGFGRDAPYGAFGEEITQANRQLTNQLLKIEAMEEQQRLKTYELQTKNDIRSNILDFRIKAAAITDPDEYRAFYDQAFPQLRKSLEKGAQVDEKRQIIFEQSWQEVTGSELDNIANGIVTRRQNLSEAQATQMRTQARDRIIEARDPNTSLMEIEKYKREIDQMPFMSPARREQIKEQTTQQLEAERNRQAVMIGVTRIRDSQDPLKEYEKLKAEFPSMDTSHLTILNNQANARESQLEHQRQKEANDLKEADVVAAMQKAYQGKMTVAELDAFIATHRNAKADDINAIRGAMEHGAITDPNLKNIMEAAALNGRLSYQEVLGARNISGDDKSKLLGMVQSSKDEKHFSKNPEYVEAQREWRLAVTGKGQYETLSEPEQVKVLAGMREIWNRSASGENPMTVSREMQNRLTPRDRVAGGAPLQLPQPMFDSKEKLVEAFRTGRIKREVFDREAEILRQWDAYEKRIQGLQQRRGSSTPTERPR